MEYRCLFCGGGLEPWEKTRGPRMCRLECRKCGASTPFARTDQAAWEHWDKIRQAAIREGVKRAAAVAADYDKMSSHDYLVSECILGKLNAMKGRPRRNRRTR